MIAIRRLVIAFCAILIPAFVTTASALAVDEWLINGAVLVVPHEVFGETTLKICDDKGGVFGEKVCISCSILTKGSVGPGKADSINDVTDLMEKDDITNCVNVENCGVVTLVEAENLPWPSEVLLSGEEFKDLIGVAGKQPGFFIECTVAGVKVTDLCEGHTTTTLVNEATDVLAGYNPNVEPSTCTRGGAANGLLEGTELIFAAGNLSVS